MTLDIKVKDIDFNVEISETKISIPMSRRLMFKKG